MKKITLPVLLLFCAFAWAGTIPKPADYTINVHVSRSRNRSGVQRLDVAVDGKKCELQSEGAPNTLLATGDYKAKLVKDEHHGTYESYRVYEFLFPDQKTRKFIVVGQTE